MILSRHGRDGRWRARRERRRTAALYLLITLGPLPGATEESPPVAEPSPSLADRLDLRFELRQEVTLADDLGDSLLNPGGELVTVDESSGLLKLDSYLEFELPANWSLSSTFAYQLSRADHTSHDFALRELYINGSFGKLDITAGRKILRWTNGFAFSPAGLLDPERNPTDPQNRLRRRRGRDLVKLDAYLGAHTLTLVATAPGLYRGDGDRSNGLLAGRWNRIAGSLDLSIMAAWRPEGPDTGALTLTWVANNSLGLTFETATTRGSQRLYPRAILPEGEDRLYGANYFAPLKATNDGLFTDWLVGVNYTFRYGLNVIAEYYHTDAGLGSAEWDRYLAQAELARSLVGDSAYPPVFDGHTVPELDLLQALQALERTDVARDYLFLRLAPNLPGRRIEASLIALLNVQDWSAVVIPDLTIEVSPRVSAYLRLKIFDGDGHSQFGNVPRSTSLNVGLRTYF